VGSIIPLEYH